MRKRQLYILACIILAFASAIAADYYFNNHNNLSTYAQDIEDSFQQNEQKVEAWLNAPQQLLDLFIFLPDLAASEKTRKLQELENLSTEKYSLFWYDHDSLLFWSKNEVLPSEAVLNKVKSTSEPLFVKLSNGYYQLEIKHLERELTGQSILSAVPLKYEYSIESDYLKNQFVANNEIPDNIILVEYPTDYPVKNKYGEIICYLDANGNISDSNHQMITLLLYILAFIFLGIFINDIANYLVVRYKPWVGASFIVGVVLGIRYLSLGQSVTDKFSNLEIFSRAFETPVMNGTLGDLIINSVLFLWLMVFFHREFKIKSLINLGPVTRFIMTSLNYLPICLGLLMITGLFKSLVADSGIVFEFDNVFNLDIFSFLSIISLILLLIALFLFTHRMMLTIKSIGMSRYARLGAMTLTLVSIIPFILSADLMMSPVKMILITLIYVLVFDIFIDNKLPGFTWLVIWLFLFSAYSAVLLFKYNLDRDLNIRKNYAVALAESRDSIAEIEINRLGEKLLKNDSLNTLFTPPLPFQVEEKLIREQIEEYLVSSNYVFSNFEYFPIAFNAASNELLIAQQEAEEIRTFIELGGEARPTPYPLLFTWPKIDKTFDYLIRYQIPIPGNPDETNMVFIGFKRKNQDATRVYTELLLNSTTRNQERLNEYDIAIYENDVLIESKGRINPEIIQVFQEMKEGMFVEKQTTIQNNLVYKGENNTYVIVARAKSGLAKGISLFSYLFVLIIATVILLSILNSIIHAIPSSLEFPIVGKPSLRNRIQLSVISLTIGSFILIGLVTVAFFRRSTNNYHENRLERKVSAILSNMENDIRLNYEQGNRTVDLANLVVPISKIHKMDINIYNPEGELLTASENYIFDRGIISGRMNRVAYEGLSSLHRKEMIHNEKIGNLTYRAAYVPIHDPDEKLLAYLGLPYYTKDRSLKSDVYDFMGTLLNVYVFLLLLAGAIAIMVANSITRPIASIGNKLKGFKLGENEPLEWDSQDELGVLIAEYNSMIQKLEESTELLKQSEREGAWREMAKQVAHEIKNPLTPMKLSMQHLVRAFQANPENIEPLLKRVSQTLIEQIDGLSKIASEFSNFAKMPRAENETFIINDLVSSVYDLFNKEQMGMMDLNLHLPDKRYKVFADKGHIMRVLNNLVKNAIQAIPDERRGKIDITVYQKEDRVVVKVSDNGQGISNEMREKVFYPNFTTKNSGMGLGLAISKNIIDALDGSIYFKTVINVGTDFYIELPIQEIMDEQVVEETKL